MNKSINRPFVWLLLESVLVMCIALWKVTGPPQLSKVAIQHENSGLDGTYCWFQGPLESQSRWQGADFYFETRCPQVAGGQALLDTAYQEFVDANGQPLNPQPQARYARPALFDDGKPVHDGRVTMSCDLGAVPLSLGAITFRSRWILPDGTFQPFSVVVRPDWLSRLSRNVKAISAKWLPPQPRENSGERVQVVLQMSRLAQPLGMDMVIGTGQSLHWQQDERGNIVSERTTPQSVLNNWSLHFQSNDGRWDSYQEIAKHIKKVLAAHRDLNPLQQAGLITRTFNSCSPTPQIGYVTHQGNLYTLNYFFRDREQEPHAQQFLADIVVPGDGMVHIKVPLPVMSPRNGRRRF